MKKLTLLLIPFLLSSCIETVAVSTFSGIYVMTRSKTVQDSVTDAKISTEIARLYASLNDIKELNEVNYNVYQGRVLLTGNIAQTSKLDDFITKIWKIKGVSEIMNEVLIGKIDRKITLDYFLATRIKTKLFLNTEIKSLDINVEVYDRTAFLIGNLNDNNEIRIASKIASKIKGVEKVISYLRVNDS